MRCVVGSLALAALTVLGGCASAPPPAEATLHGQPVAARSPVVPCTTTRLVIATVSQCGPGGLTLGVAAD